MTAPAPPPPFNDRRADRALFGPPTDTDGSFDNLPDELPDGFPTEEEALVASLIDVPADATAPAEVMNTLLQNALPSAISPQPVKTVAAEPTEQRRPLVRPAIVWAVVATGLLVLASMLLPTISSGRRTARFLEMNPYMARERVLDADNLLRVPLTGNDDAAFVGVGAAGEALWDGKSQQGVLALVGLKPNDPSNAQYQLWIFDAERDERYPVDGGVFDVPAGARPGEEVLVPFEPRVPVGRATLFAVTVERPGGVVVSDRSRLPVAGAAPPDPG